MTAKQATHIHADYSQQGRAYRFSVKQPRMCSHSSSGRGGSGSEAAAWPPARCARERVCGGILGGGSGGGAVAGRLLFTADLRDHAALAQRVSEVRGARMAQADSVLVALSRWRDSN